MSFSLIAIALGWGLVAGYLTLRGLASLLGMVFCLQALLRWRWQRLAGKLTTGVKPGSNLDLLVKLSLWLLLFAALLQLGDNYVRFNLGFAYAGRSGIAFGLAAVGVILALLPATRRRLLHYWRMSHVFDYAERRRRTQLLR